MPKNNLQILAIDRKFKMILIKVLINWKDQVKFDQVKKNKKTKSFDQTPNLTENFDQLKISSEIRSSDHSPIILS